jgi:O-antigen ligase
MNAILAKPTSGLDLGRGMWFRLARIFLLVLIVIMPMEAITAAREMAMVGAALFLFLHLWLTGDRKWRPTVLLWPWVFYVLFAGLSLLSAVDPAYSLKEFRAEVLKGLLLFYTGVHFIREEEHIKQVWGALLIGAVLMGVFAVFFFFIQGGNLLHHYLRAGSLHNGYGGFGTYLVTIWPFVLLAPNLFDSPRWRPAWLGLIAISAFAGYLTFSRATWMGMLIELGLCLVIMSQRRLRTALVGGLICLALVTTALCLVPGARHGERWSQLLKNPAQVGGTAGDLIAVWRHSLAEIAQHPFTGIGLGRHSFSKSYPEFRATHQPLLWHSHNMFIEAALQMGLQGLLAILWAFIALVQALWPHAPPEKEDAAGLFGAAAALMVVGFSVRNFTDDFFVDDTGFLFWLLAGLALGARWWKYYQSGNHYGNALNSTEKKPVDAL